MTGTECCRRSVVVDLGDRSHPVHIGPGVRAMLPDQIVESVSLKAEVVAADERAWVRAPAH